MHFGTQRLIVSDTVWPAQPFWASVLSQTERVEGPGGGGVGGGGGGGGCSLRYHVAVIRLLNNLQRKDYLRQRYTATNK